MHLFISQRILYIRGPPSDLTAKSKEWGLKTLDHMPSGLELAFAFPLTK